LLKRLRDDVYILYNSLHYIRMEFTKKDINVLVNLDPEILDSYILNLEDDELQALKYALLDYTPQDGGGLAGDVLGIASPFTKFEWLVGVIDLLRDTDVVRG